VAGLGVLLAGIAEPDKQLQVGSGLQRQRSA
jgi:hypothetical protein